MFPRFLIISVALCRCLRLKDESPLPGAKGLNDFGEERTSPASWCMLEPAVIPSLVVWCARAMIWGGAGPREMSEVSYWLRHSGSYHSL